MFVNSEGMSSRPPIQWSYPLRALTYSHPYILGLSDDVIIVYRYLLKEIEDDKRRRWHMWSPTNPHTVHSPDYQWRGPPYIVEG